MTLPGIPSRLTDALASDPALRALGPPDRLAELTRTLWLPVADAIYEALGSSPPPLVVGMAGAPGAGKTTLATALAAIFGGRGLASARLSLEDTYHEPEERRRRGLKWRAVPGSHDLEMLGRCLQEVRGRNRPVVLPRFDMQADRRIADERVPAVDVLFFEGWFVGTRLPDYAFLRPLIDCLVFVDVPQEVAHRSRLAREEKARCGFDASTMRAFWNEALGPGVPRWVLPIRDDADIVITLDTERRPISFTPRRLYHTGSCYQER